MIGAKAKALVGRIRNGREGALAGVLLYIVAALLLMNWLSQPGLRDAPWYPLISALGFAAFLASLLLIYYVSLAGAVRALLGAVTLLVLLPVLGVRNTFLLEVATQVGIFAAMALGLNIVVGFAGLLDLGYVAFYAVGAYLWAIFGSPQANVAFGTNRFPLAPEWFFVFLFLAVGVAALTGILLGLPVLRLRGDYLAIVTLAFGEVIRVIVNNLDKPINLTNGPQGIRPIQRPPLFFKPWLETVGIRLDEPVLYGLYFYFLVLLVIGFAVLLTRRLEDSWVGRAWTAIREDELAAQVMGIPLVRMKLAAFATGASFAGAMGMIFAAKQYFINPESFTFMESIGILVMVIVGGMGSIPGAIVGATVVTILNLQILKGLSLMLSKLRQAGFVVPLINFPLSQWPTQLEPAKYERLIFGILLILMMILRPQGLIPERRHRMELAEALGREEAIAERLPVVAAPEAKPMRD
ncbi:MAG: branched-chain amino acid ABC transporter permease [Thermoflexus sp.]